MYNFFSSPDLFFYSHIKTINCCGTVRVNQKGITTGFAKKLSLKQGDIKDWGEG
jgi:hypothetical protein